MNLSNKSTTIKRTTPIVDKTTSAANMSGKSKLPFATCKTYPIPEFDPTNSPTTAPTTASVMATFRPLKIAGRAWGKENLKKVWNLLAPIDLARSTISLSTDLNPMTVDTTTGKKPSKNAEIIFGKIPNPNQTTNNGAIATLGMLCEKTKTGYRYDSTILEYEISIARGIPIIIVRANPPSVAWVVFQLSDSSLGHSK